MWKLASVNRDCRLLALDCCLVSQTQSKTEGELLNKVQPFNNLLFKYPLEIQKLVVATEQWDVSQLEVFSIENIKRRLWQVFILKR